MNKRKSRHLYTKEEDKWLQDNFKLYKNIDELTDRFNELFHTDIEVYSMRGHCNRQLNINMSTYFPWTQEQREWVRDNFNPNERAKDLTARFNNTFGVNAKPKTVYAYINKGLGFRSAYVRHDYTQEEDNWIAENYCKFSGKRLTEEFNKRFDHSVTENALKARGQKLGVQNRVKLHFYTNEELKWLLENYTENIIKYKKQVTNEFPLQATLKQFNEHFGTNVTYYSIFAKCKNLKLTCGGQGFALGEERVDANYIKVKVSNGKAQNNWRYKHYIEWEKYHNMPLPKGKTVVFLNGDYEDFSKENLYCVDDWVSHAFARYERHDIETGLAILAYLMLGKEIKNKKKELKEKAV